jgi:hypothetical protein
LSLITSKPMFTNPSEMSSAGIVNGGSCITAFAAFWDLAWKISMGDYCSRTESGRLKNPPFLSWQLWSNLRCYGTWSFLSVNPSVAFCNCIRFTREVSITGGCIPAWLDGTCCCWPYVESSASFWSSSISVDLRGAKKFRVGISSFDGSWGSLIPVVDDAGFLTLSLASSVGYNHLIEVSSF